ncbi:MAG: hypothetical protein JNK73_08380 [Bacteroidia bacterium]|nr:hypothetical protein [Bacteroidia bacterium]
MKLFYTFSVVTLLLMACISSKKAPLEFPEAMRPEVQADYRKTCERGYVLYKLSCAKCHTSKKWGREIIPDFSDAQLQGYALRMANKQHENNLPDSLISEVDFGDIMLFLKYKKKSNAPFISPAEVSTAPAASK